MENIIARFERLAVHVRLLALPFGVVSAVLLFVTVTWWHVLPNGTHWLLILVMMWTGGIAMVVLMFRSGPQSQSIVRSHGRFMQLYITWFMSLWWAFLVLYTVLSFIEFLKNAW